MNDSRLDELVAMSRYLGDPARGYAILGEGNTSARIDDDTFYIKASGTTLSGIDAAGFVRVSISKVTAILDDSSAGDDDVTRVLREAMVDRSDPRRPSVEAMLHAILLGIPAFSFVAHTHPVYTCMLLCSQMAEKASQIIVGAYAAGGPKFMTPKDVERIHTRPDEKYRVKSISG